LERLIFKDIAIKTSIRIKENQKVTEVVPLFEHSFLEGLPVYNLHDQLIGILPRDIAMNAADNGVSNITILLLSQDYILVADTDYINTLAYSNKGYYLVQNKYKSIVGMISKSQLKDSYNELLKFRMNELETVFEHAPIGIGSVDKNGYFTSLNPAAERILGVKKEDAVGRFLSDVSVLGGVLEVLRTREAQVAKKITVGKRKYITTRTPIMEEKSIKGVVSVFQDISELEEISKELDSVRQLYKQLEAIITSSYDGIIIADCDGDFIRYNQAIEKLYKLDTLNRYTNNLFKNFPSYEADIIKKVINDKRSLTISHVMEEPGIILSITINPVISDENIDYLVINVRNITDLINLEKEIEQTKLLTDRYKEELFQYRMELKSRVNFIAESPRMKQILNLVKKVSSFESTTLILGESGTGKEEIARLIHLNSLRSDGPLITVNCGAIPEALLESELFGYEKGAFTGAGQKGKPGMFELADKGTLFLDEIGDLPLQLQVKLLRVIQEREVTRIGGIKPIAVDVRILAATNLKLEEKVKDGEFRHDLYYRLNVIPILLPPLRDREEDLIPLIEMFLNEFNNLYSMSKKFTRDSYDILLKYEWPGNVRELKNVIERSFVLSEGDSINLKEINLPLFNTKSVSTQHNINEIRPLKEAVMEYEKILIEQAIEKYGNTYKAAEVLNVDQSTIVRKLQKLKKVF
jgi:PAS domain S-box-containing protein